MKDVPYSYAMRFEDAPGTNPEELVAAAHAACFSMALSGELGKVSLKPEWVKTTCSVTFEKTEKGFALTESHLATHVKVPMANKAAVEKAANDAKAGCPISRLLNARITLEVRIET